MPLLVLARPAGQNVGMDSDRNGYPDDVSRPDVMPVHVAVWLGHLAVVLVPILAGIALTMLRAFWNHQ